MEWWEKQDAAEARGWRLEAGRIYGPDGRPWGTELPRNWSTEQCAEKLYLIAQNFKPEQFAETMPRRR
jgi:hypothetical protein